MRFPPGITARLGRRRGRRIEVHIYADTSYLERVLADRVRQELLRAQRRNGGLGIQ